MKPVPVLPAGDMQRIAIFRALMLGDMLCAVPALRALRAAYPGAELTLIGLPWARALAARLPCVDGFIEFTGHPGLPESPARLEELPGLLSSAQARRFDLVLQMHGNGRVVNPLVAAFGARHTAAFFMPDGYCPDDRLGVPWPEQGHEIERCLALTDHLGLPREGLSLDMPIGDADRRRAARLAGDSPYAVVHPGAQLSSRRWPVERFARVADALATRGLRVLITGAASEQPLVNAMQAAMRHPSFGVAGQTSLWELAALVEGARLVVCNDTGVSHVAAAMHTPSVVVASGSDVARWGPLDTRRHRVLWQQVPCRPCAFAVCPTGHECALAVRADDVIAQALDLRESYA